MPKDSQESTTKVRVRKPFSVPLRDEEVEMLAEPVKSQSDKKLYRTIRLKNGLTALLVSDQSSLPPDYDDSSETDTSESESDQSITDDESSFTESESNGTHHSSSRCPVFGDEKMAACALCVGVGSYSDPWELQGLAHFVEHMVFMGSAKYPKENEFDAFIEKKGGSNNGETNCKRTTFHFEIEEKYLLQAMDMFSQFFVDPLMLKEAMQREREAIDSEFALTAPSDPDRVAQLLYSLFPEGNPARKFSWGNMKSLRDDVGDDEKLYQAAHEFRKRHYSAHRMKAAIQARLSLDTLQRYVVDTLGQIPTNDLPPEDFSPYAFTPEQITPQFTSLFYVKPIKDTIEVNLTWCMRSLKSEYMSNPHRYISEIIKHEGKGSLLSYLRKNAWALDVDASISDTEKNKTSMYGLFSIDIKLTKNGLEHVDEVLEAVFSYISMLRQMGPSERIYNEIKTILDTMFRFEDELDVKVIAESHMHDFPPEYFITGDDLFYKYDPKIISEMLANLTPERANVMILSKKHSTPVDYDATEKWFGTEYRREDIPVKWLERWSKVEPYKCFHLPEENVYITTNFDLIQPALPYVEAAKELDIDLQDCSRKEIYKRESSKTEHKPVTFVHDNMTATVNNFRLDEPNLLRKNELMELWYKPDFRFQLPTAVLYFYFVTPCALKSPKEACLVDLWVDVLEQTIKESVFPANMANLTHAVSADDCGFFVNVVGYSQKLHLLVDLLSREMRSVTTELTESMFMALREECARDYQNMLMDPLTLAFDVRMNVLADPYICLRDQVKIVRSITLDEFKKFNQNILDRLYMQVLVQGNLAWYDAVKISDTVMQNIKFDALASNEMPKIRVRELPVGVKKLRLNSLNRSNANSVITSYYQCGVATPNGVAVPQMLLTLMEEPLYHHLRTKEQLGYNVSLTDLETYGILGYSITVVTQVDKFSASYVDSRIEAFLRKFAHDCRRLSEKDLAETRRALLQLKHIVDCNIEEEADRNWSEITSGKYRFNRSFAEAEAIEQVKLVDLKNWASDNFSTKNKKIRKKLSVQIIGHNAHKPSDANPAESELSFDIQYTAPTRDHDEENSEDFILDVEEFKTTLPILRIPKVRLPEF